jgi:hypothetical protein
MVACCGASHDQPGNDGRPFHLACQNASDAVGAAQSLETVQAETPGFVLVVNGRESKALGEPAQTMEWRRYIAGPGLDLAAGSYVSRQTENGALGLAVRPAVVESAVS